jgi:hypothetical protein
MAAAPVTAAERVTRALDGDVVNRCYAASEALYHLEPGRYTPVVLRLSATLTHWWLRDRATGEVVDLTAAQFPEPVDYGAGRGCGFLTLQPSRAARELIRSTVS